MKRHISLLAIALSVPFAAGAHPAAATGLFTFVDPCDLVLINTDTGNSTIVGSLGWSIEAMDYGPDGLLYATVEHFCGTHGNARELATIDPATLAVTVIGDIGFDDVDALAFAPDGMLFGIAVGSNQLITIDPTTGAGTAVGAPGSLGPPFVGAIEFLPDGTLVGVDMTDGSGGPSTFLTIDSSTGVATAVGPVGFDSIEGISLDPKGQLFALANTLEPPLDAQLVLVDPSTGAGTLVQAVPTAGACDALVVTTHVTCTGDLDGDGAVGFTDLTTLLGQWGPCAGCRADLDRNGTVGFTDLTAMLGAWGACN